MEREKFASRLGFILISAGCAIGLGNVWRFPFITGKYGGAAFVLVYLVFLVILGLPIMVMEFAVGRASQKSAALSFNVLEPKGTKWHLYRYGAMAGNYLLMMFYTTVGGWMLAYVCKMFLGEFQGMDSGAVTGVFFDMLAQPGPMIGWMLVVTLLGFGICSLGLQKGVERITKVMMTCLLLLMLVLVVRSVTLDGAMEGLRFYLVPDFHNLLYDAEGSFILGAGVLDTFVALIAGLIIFPACFAFGVQPDQGVGLVFMTLPNVFNQMPLGNVWGGLFFLFMSFAALSTIIAVFENIISFWIDMFGISRKKSVLINTIIILIASLPCVFGFNIWSGFQIFGQNVLGMEDFLVSNILLPVGSLVYLLFCVTKFGWGFDNYLDECNTGKGIKFSMALKPYFKYVLPVLVLILIVQGFIK